MLDFNRANVSVSALSVAINELIERAEPRYPLKMIRDGRDAILFARSEIDPSGNVISVTATAFPRERAELLFEFEKEARRAFGLWVFPPAPEGTTAPRFFCSDIIFRLRR
jgi:hypothetical protein